MRRPSAAILRIGLIAILGAAILVALPSLGKEWILSHQHQASALMDEALEKNSGLAFLLVSGAFAIGALTAILPLSLLAILTGSIAGVTIKIWLATFIGTAVGALLSFLLARYSLRRYVDRWVSKRLSWEQFDRVVAAQGWRFVLLVRLSPVAPFSLISYCFGLTKVTTGNFLLGSLGAAPALATYLYSGALSKNFLSVLNGAESSQKWLHAGLLAIGLAATLMAAVVLGRIVKNIFRVQAMLEPAVDARAGRPQSMSTNNSE